MNRAYAWPLTDAPPIKYTPWAAAAALRAAVDGCSSGSMSALQVGIGSACRGNWAAAYGLRREASEGRESRVRTTVSRVFTQNHSKSDHHGKSADLVQMHQRTPYVGAEVVLVQCATTQVDLVPARMLRAQPHLLKHSGKVMSWAPSAAAAAMASVATLRQSVFTPLVSSWHSATLTCV